MELYNALCPYYQNDQIEIREAEPYSYCQFIIGPDHTAYGRARHPFMTGSAGWAYYAATRSILGIRPQFTYLEIDPCIPSDWREFFVKRIWREATYEIYVKNPNGRMKGVKVLFLDGKKVEQILPQQKGTVHKIEVLMG